MLLSNIRVGNRGVPRIWQGGRPRIFFFRFGNLHVAKLWGFGGMLPRENFLKWCHLVRFGVYFDHILSLKNYKKKLPFFYIKKLKIAIFYIKEYIY